MTATDPTPTLDAVLEESAAPAPRRPSSGILEYIWGGSMIVLVTLGVVLKGSLPFTMIASGVDGHIVGLLAMFAGMLALHRLYDRSWWLAMLASVTVMGMASALADTYLEHWVFTRRHVGIVLIGITPFVLATAIVRITKDSHAGAAPVGEPVGEPVGDDLGTAVREKVAGKRAFSWGRSGLLLLGTLLIAGLGIIAILESWRFRDKAMYEKEVQERGAGIARATADLQAGTAIFPEFRPSKWHVPLLARKEISELSDEFVPWSTLGKIAKNPIFIDPDTGLPLVPAEIHGMSGAESLGYQKGIKMARQYSAVLNGAMVPPALPALADVSPGERFDPATASEPRIVGALRLEVNGARDGVDFRITTRFGDRTHGRIAGAVGVFEFDGTLVLAGDFFFTTPNGFEPTATPALLLLDRTTGFIGGQEYFLPADWESWRDQARGLRGE